MHESHQQFLSPPIPCCALLLRLPAKLVEYSDFFVLATALLYVSVQVGLL